MIKMGTSTSRIASHLCGLRDSEANASKTTIPQAAHREIQGDNDSNPEEAARANAPALPPPPHGPHFYTPLPRGTIRLLTLHPSPLPSSPLRGSLHHRRLSDPALSYEAISYAWNDPNSSPAASPSIVLDDGETHLPITPSASAVLRRLRPPDLPRVLWIDSICVNQSDDAEKSRQVGIMDRIFASASGVLCWLGEDGDGNAATAVDLIVSIGRADFTRPRDWGRVGDAEMEVLGLPTGRDRRWACLGRFFRRPWFRRLWVVQEFVLGPERTVVLCGARELAWEEFAPGLILIDRYRLLEGVSMDDDESAASSGDDCVGVLLLVRLIVLKLRNANVNLVRALDLFGNVDGRELESRRALIRELHHANPDRMFAASATIMAQDIQAGDLTYAFLHSAMRGKFAIQIEPEWPSLDSVLSLFEYSLVTDPRDRFYACLKISSESENPSLQPDYSESVEATYIRFSRWLLLNSQVDPYMVEAGVTRRLPNRHVPSWVRPFSRPSNVQKAFTWTKLRNMEAAGITGRTIRPTAEPRKLHIAAGYLDTISWVIQSPSDEVGSHNVISVLEWERFFRDLDKITTSSNQVYPFSIGDVDGSEVQCNLLTAGCQDVDSDDDWRREFLEVRRALQAASILLKENGGVTFAYNMPSWYWRWRAFATEYSVCQTKGGLVGMVPNAVEAGNEIWIILGENMPLVLRRSGSAGTEHQLIGACYVHGIMNGEALDSDRWREEEICLV